MISAGLIGGVASALFGVIDWLGIPRGTRAKRIGLFHGFGNAFVLLLFGMSWFSRMLEPSRPSRHGGRVSAMVGVVLMGVTGWLGGELIARLGVSVDEGAHVNAPSSLSGQPASAVECASGAGCGRQAGGSLAATSFAEPQMAAESRRHCERQSVTTDEHGSERQTARIRNATAMLCELQRQRQRL